MRDHGGNLDEAMRQFGGAPSSWIDLSTGINPRAFPMPVVAPHLVQALPTRADVSALSEVAARAYGASVPPLPCAGASAAIQCIPMVLEPGKARVLGPTYNEHAAALRSAGWTVDQVSTLTDLAGADLAVVVNPNNPDGQRHTPSDLFALAERVGHLVVDESFGDITPDLSLAPMLDDRTDDITVLRSFGKFYGLAGLRLGFALTGAGTRARLTERLGPWSVSGPAIAAGLAALPDLSWAEQTRRRLARDAERLDGLAANAGWLCLGGTSLFRLYDTADAAKCHSALAARHIWTRRFPYSDRWLRLGLPDGDHRWAQLERALRALSAS